jgi:hypothetical protein
MLQALQQMLQSPQGKQAFMQFMSQNPQMFQALQALIAQNGGGGVSPIGGGCSA